MARVQVDQLGLDVVRLIDFHDELVVGVLDLEDAQDADLRVGPPEWYDVHVPIIDMRHRARSVVRGPRDRDDRTRTDGGCVATIGRDGKPFPYHLAMN